MRALQVLAWMSKQAEKGLIPMQFPAQGYNMGANYPRKGVGSIDDFHRQGSDDTRMGAFPLITGNHSLKNNDSFSFDDVPKRDVAGGGSNAGNVNFRMNFLRENGAKPIDAFAKPNPAATPTPQANTAKPYASEPTNLGKGFFANAGETLSNTVNMGRVAMEPYMRGIERNYVDAKNFLSGMGRAAMPALTYIKGRYTHPGMNLLNGDFDLSRINRPAYGDPRWEEDYNTAKTYAFDPDPNRRLNAAIKMRLDKNLGKNAPGLSYGIGVPGSVPFADRVKDQERLHNDYWKEREHDRLHGTVDAVNKVTAPGMQSVWNLHPKANQKPFNPWGWESGLPRPPHPSKMFNAAVKSNEDLARSGLKFPEYRDSLDSFNNGIANSWVKPPANWRPTGDESIPYYPENSANAYILKSIINSPHRLKLDPEHIYPHK